MALRFNHNGVSCLMSSRQRRHNYRMPRKQPNFLAISATIFLAFLFITAAMLLIGLAWD